LFSNDIEHFYGTFALYYEISYHVFQIYDVKISIAI